MDLTISISKTKKKPMKYSTWENRSSYFKPKLLSLAYDGADLNQPINDFTFSKMSCA